MRRREVGSLRRKRATEKRVSPWLLTGIRWNSMDRASFARETTSGVDRFDGITAGWNRYPRDNEVGFALSTSAGASFKAAAENSADL